MTVVAGPLFAAAGLLAAAGAVKLVQPASTIDALRGAAALPGTGTAGAVHDRLWVGRLLGWSRSRWRSSPWDRRTGRPARSSRPLSRVRVLHGRACSRRREPARSCGCFGARRIAGRAHPCHGQRRASLWSRPSPSPGRHPASQTCCVTSPWAACPSSAVRGAGLAAVRPADGRPRAAGGDGRSTGPAARFVVRPMTVLVALEGAVIVAPGPAGRRPPAQPRGDPATPPRTRRGHRDVGPSRPAGRVRSGGREFRVMPQVPSPPDREGFTGGHDLVGTGLDDDAITVRITGVDHDTVVAFLSSGCLTCRRFWDAFAEPGTLGLPSDVRVVVATKDPAEESLSVIAGLAPSTLPLVMSSQAWADYDVPGLAVLRAGGRSDRGGPGRRHGSRLGPGPEPVGPGHGRRVGGRRTGGQPRSPSRGPTRTASRASTRSCWQPMCRPGDPSLYEMADDPAETRSVIGPVFVARARGGRARSHPQHLVAVRRVDALEHHSAR